MPLNTDPAFIGRAWMTPVGPIVAGQLGTWTITYEAGAYGCEERARIRIASYPGDRVHVTIGDRSGGGPGSRARTFRVAHTARRVEWRSNTTGDDDGVDLTVEAVAGGVRRFRTPLIDLDVPLVDLDEGATRIFPAGGVDLRAFMRRLPARDLTRELRIDHTDPAPAAARCHAYWIRVTQEDGAQAWTSPVYLDAR